MEKIDTLRVLLGEMPVGTLTLDRSERCEFRLLESYKEAYPRPVLGQVFLDDPDKIYTTRARVPAWFSNLLPEGPLRDFVAQQAGVISSREFFLLHHLGEDLPGAVRIVADEPLSESKVAAPSARAGAEEAQGLHFSLAGVQLKFSARRAERGLTIPVSGIGGDWIVKLPDTRYPQVPRNEWATMRWAAASGIETPEVDLIDIGDLTGLPPAFRSFPERRALVIRRFDRLEEGRRVHMEDFAQVLGLYPEEKYRRFNYETIARVLFALSGEEALDAFIRRLVFIAAAGNGDAHHKNWSLIYPDGRTPRLSPAYDLVSTIQYLPEDNLALNFGKTKRWEEITLDAFRRLARKLGAAEGAIADQVDRAAHDIFAAWNASEERFGFTDADCTRLREHWRRMPLLARYL
jgi:serine/threonine-protein kinase HipA